MKQLAALLILLSSCSMYTGVYEPVRRMPAAYQSHFRGLTQAVQQMYKEKGYEGAELDSLTLITVGKYMRLTSERGYRHLEANH